MSDFCITKVRYNADGKHIDYVIVREELPGKIGNERTVDRAFVADLIRKGKASFQTRVFNSAAQSWSVGAAVHVVDDVYLSTDRNNTKRDNLGNLPAF